MAYKTPQLILIAVTFFLLDLITAFFALFCVTPFLLIFFIMTDAAVFHRQQSSSLLWTVALLLILQQWIFVGISPFSVLWLFLFMIIMEEIFWLSGLHQKITYALLLFIGMGLQQMFTQQWSGLKNACMNIYIIKSHNKNS